MILVYKHSLNSDSELLGRTKVSVAMPNLRRGTSEITSWYIVSIYRFVVFKLEKNYRLA
jgi:hypothetical protein